jgi:hypothetical protein
MRAGGNVRGIRPPCDEPVGTISTVIEVRHTPILSQPENSGLHEIAALFLLMR